MSEHPGGRQQSGEGGAQQAVTRPADLFRAYLANHGSVAVDSLRRLTRTLPTSLMTWMVIGIALALPSWIYVLLENTRNLSQGWEDSPKISVYVDNAVETRGLPGLRADISAWPEVARVDFISREAALEEFKANSGFQEVLDTLPGNPLPSVLVVRPVSRELAAIETLADRLERTQGVDSIAIDFEWLTRLFAMLRIAERMVFALYTVLGLAIILVIGNTIRLTIENRRAEIEVVKLVGATDAFVRRPFLYTGLWFGFGGGLIAYSLVEGTLVWLGDPIRNLMGLYGSEFRLRGFDGRATFGLLVGGALLGWAGALLAVNSNLRDIEPR